MCFAGNENVKHLLIEVSGCFLCVFAGNENVKHLFIEVSECVVDHSEAYITFILCVFDDVL